jgi:hypothetical protein
MGEMKVITNERPLRSIGGYLLAALLIYTAIDYAIKGEEWFRVVVHLCLVIFLIRSQRSKQLERISRIEIEPLMIRVFRDNGMMREIAGSEIEEIPMNDLCARIDYRREGYKLELLLEKKSFTEATWQELQRALREVPVPSTSDRVPAS